VLGVAVAVAGFVVAVLAPSIAGDVALRTEFGQLPIADRLISAVSIDAQAKVDPKAADFVRRRLAQHGFDDVVRQTALRPLADAGGTVFRLVGIDDLAGKVALTDGRLPTQCTATRCEAVLWLRDTAAKSVTFNPDWHLHIVGTVQRIDERVLAGTFAPGDEEAVVLVNGADAVDNIAALQLLQRSSGWISSIPANRLRVAEVPTLLADIGRLGERNDVINISVTAPDDELRSVARRARITTNRLALPVGQAAALLVGFTVITTLAIRSWHRRGRRVLHLRAASRWSERCFTAFEAAIVVAVGAVLGLLVAVAVTLAVANAARVDGAAAIRRLGESSTLSIVVALVIVCWLITVSLLGAELERPRTRRRVRGSDVLGIASVGVWLLAARRGSTSASSLANGSDPLLSVTPLVAGCAAACIVVRVLPMVQAVASRLVPRRRWPTRLALVGALGRGIRPVATAAFVAATVTLATFALGYRSTLRVASGDQAAFAVPVDFLLREGSSLIRPQAVASAAEWQAMDQGATASDVLRRGLALRRSGTSGETVEILGVNPQILDRLVGWRSDFGDAPSPNTPRVGALRQSGTAIPAGSKQLSLTTSSRLPNVSLTAVFERADGTWHEELAVANEAGTTWAVTLNLSDNDRWLHGFRLGESATSVAHTLHNINEGTSTDVDAIAIDVVLNEVAVDQTPLVVDWASASSTGGTVQLDNGQARFAAVVHAGSTLLLIGEPTLQPLPAIVDPITASTARNGLVTLETSGQGSIAVRVAGIANQFPTIGSRFAVVDGPSLSRALNRLQPGSGTPTEMWLSVDNPTALETVTGRLGGQQFTHIDVASRREIERRLTGNTLGRAVVLAFLLSSLIAALLGAVALVYVAHAERLDGLPVLRALKADGARPRQLVAILTMRTVALLVAAVPVGVGCGVVLLRAVRGLVDVSADGTRPTPSLRTVIEPLQVVGCAAGIAALALLGTGLVAQTVRSIRGQDTMAGQS
jgi:hypothetical protein